ncbi:hypothetical protein HK405_004444 [Cladochytrium tenue]|nr:hypothetical protein HK405_004444 [Cladochytrium tenue]
MSSPEVAAVAQSLAPVLNHDQLLMLLAIAPSCLGEGGLPADLRKPWMAVFCAALENYLPPPTGAEDEVIVANVFEITRVRVDKLEADGRAPEEAFSHMIEETLIHNGSILGCFLELLPTPATTPSPVKAPLKPRLARALALELFRAVKEHATTVGLWPYIQLARRLLKAQPGLHAFPPMAARAMHVLEAKLSECLRIQLVAPHVQALETYPDLEEMRADTRGIWEQFVTVAFCEMWEVELTRAPVEQLVEQCFSELRRVAVDMYDALEAATQDS